MRNDFEENYLAHWGLKKGEKRQNHKYVERVEIGNGKYLYFYTWAQYKAYMKNKGKQIEGAGEKATSAVNDLKNKTKASLTKQNVSKTVSNGKSMLNNFLGASKTKLTKDNANKVINNGQNAIDRLLERASKAQQNSKAINTFLDKAKKAQEKAQPQIDKALNKAKEVQEKTQSKIEDAGKKLQSKVENSKAAKKAKEIAEKVQKKFEDAGKNAQKVMNEYAEKGQKKIEGILKKAGSINLGSTQKVGGVGTAIVVALLASAAVAAVTTFVVNKIKEEKEWKEYLKNENNRRESEGRKRESEGRNKAKEVEKRRALSNLFSKDAKDSFKEDTAVHTDIPMKEDETSKKDDMLAVNQGNFKEGFDFKEYEAYGEEFNKWWELYEQTGDNKYFDLAEKAYAEYIERYFNNYGYLNNCATCTLTYDLRRRGYDVDAPWNEGTDPDTIKDWYKMSDSDIDVWDSNGRSNNFQPFTKEESIEIVSDINNKYPEGSYGHFIVHWSKGGAHDCVWSKEDGKIIIRDCQSGEVVSPHEYLQDSYEVDYFRADDKEINDWVYDSIMSDNVNDKYQSLDDNEYHKKKRKKNEEFKYNWN